MLLVQWCHACECWCLRMSAHEYSWMLISTKSVAQRDSYGLLCTIQQYYTILDYIGLLSYQTIVDFTRIYWYIPDYIGKYWTISEYSGLYWTILDYNLPHHTLPAWNKMYKIKLNYTCPCWNILDYDSYTTIYLTIVGYYRLKWTIAKLSSSRLS